MGPLLTTAKMHSWWTPCEAKDKFELIELGLYSMAVLESLSADVSGIETKRAGIVSKGAISKNFPSNKTASQDPSMSQI